jgi:hypothetical protein
MSEQQQKKSFNSTFTEIKKWKSSETKEQYLVLSLITDNDTNKKSFFFNKQWTTQKGESGRGKGVTIPLSLASEVSDALKIAQAKEAQN